MSAFSKIIAAAESCGLRAFPDVYEGKDLDRWVVYQYTTEYGDLYGDDAPEAITGTVQVKLILPEMWTRTGPTKREISSSNLKRTKWRNNHGICRTEKAYYRAPYS